MNGEVGLKALEGGGAVALYNLHVADLHIASREVALPLGIARIAGGLLVANSERGLKALEGGGAVALGNLHVADLLIADREVALPLGIARIAGG